MSTATFAAPMTDPVLTESRRFPRRTQFVPIARTWTRSVLAAWRIGETAVDDAMLIVTELATNAAVHVPADGGDMTVGLAVWHGRLRITVSDPGPACEQVRPCVAFQQDEGRRGLAIVENLADSFGCECVSFGKVVFAELKIGGAS